ncbi:MAG: hypothetical protein ACXWC9_02175 [Pseudobdellovibrionaceae bacterium]
MNKFILLVCVILTFPFASQAGFIKENGGNVLVCQLDSGQTSSDLLDFFEASQFLRPDNLNFTKLVGKTKQQVLSEVLAIISEVRGETSNPYPAWLASFESEATFVRGVKLGTITDSYHFIVPRNCTVEQTVIQIEPLFHEARYTISQDLWEQLSPSHQAGLQMHELIYRELNSEDSRLVRIINAVLFSDEIRELTLAQKKDLLKILRF